VRGRVAAGCTGLLLDVERALATTAAQCVRLVVALTEACRTLAYNLRQRRASVACVAISHHRYAPPRCTHHADVLLPFNTPSHGMSSLPPSYTPVRMQRSAGYTLPCIHLERSAGACGRKNGFRVLQQGFCGSSRVLGLARPRPQNPCARSTLRQVPGCGRQARSCVHRRVSWCAAGARRPSKRHIAASRHHSGIDSPLTRPARSRRAAARRPTTSFASPS
jgi:hypothetical protein